MRSRSRIPGKNFPKTASFNTDPGMGQYLPEPDDSGWQYGAGRMKARVFPVGEAFCDRVVGDVWIKGFAGT
jgi:hypothetical protein